MVGFVQRKKIVVMMFAMITCFSASGMGDVVLSMKEVTGTGIAGLLAAAGTTALVLGEPQNHVAAIAGAGVVLGGLSFFIARERTPDRIVQRAWETKEKIENYSRIKHLVNDERNINIDNIQAIVGGDWPLKATLDDIEKYQNRINEYLVLFKKIRGKGLLNDYNMHVTEESLVKYRDNMGTVATVINRDLNKELSEQIARFYTVKNINIEQQKVENEKMKIQISKQEANVKTGELMLKYKKWLWIAIPATPLLLWLLAWSLHLPYPSY